MVDQKQAGGPATSTAGARAWHGMTVAEVAENLDVRPEQGLSAAEAAKLVADDS